MTFPILSVLFTLMFIGVVGYVIYVIHTVDGIKAKIPNEDDLRAKIAAAKTAVEKVEANLVKARWDLDHAEMSLHLYLVSHYPHKPGIASEWRGGQQRAVQLLVPGCFYAWVEQVGDKVMWGAALHNGPDPKNRTIGQTIIDNQEAPSMEAAKACADLWLKWHGVRLAGVDGVEYPQEDK